MSLKIRRLIYLFFILIFLVSAPILILYAAGYRYNFWKTKFQKTGALFLETRPKGAAILIENQPGPSQTTSQISNLLPGDYLVKLTKDGYFDWQKKLPVYAETVTFAKEVILFKNNSTASQLIAQPILSALASIDNQKIMVVALNGEQAELWLVDLTRATASRLELTYQPQDQFELLAWAPSQKKILIKKITEKQIDYLVLNTEKPEEITILSNFTALPKNPKQIKWDLTNDNKLYAQAGNIVYKINLASQTVEPLKIKTAGDFLINNDSIYYLITKADANYPMRQSLTDSTPPEDLAELPTNGNYTFLGQTNNLIILSGPVNQNLLVINPDKKEIILNAKAKDIHWSVNQQELLYYNDLEIWIYYLTDQSKELITRYSQPIREVIWYPMPTGRQALPGYLIFNQKIAADKDTLTIIELDSRDYRQTIKLLETEEINHLAIDQNGENIFFTAKIGQQTGLYELNIH